MCVKKPFIVLTLVVLANSTLAAESNWDRFEDGSLGQATEFRGAGGLVIPAYVRKPKGEGPFPVVVMLHRGRYRKGASAGMARSTRTPVAAFIRAGWVVYCTDYRPNDKISIEPIEADDSGLMFYASAFAYLQKRAGSKPAAQPEKVKQQDTSKLIPLTDLGTNEYKGFRGGLYPDGKNTRPADHEAAGIELARHIRPLDPDGKPNPDGKIVLLGIGFSNTVQAFNGFMQVAKEDKDLNPKLVLVNGAKGGRSAFMIQNPDDGKMGTAYWQDVDKKLKAGGVARRQVQVVWIKETNPNPPDPGFPKFTRDL